MKPRNVKICEHSIFVQSLNQNNFRFLLNSVGEVVVVVYSFLNHKCLKTIIV